MPRHERLAEPDPLDQLRHGRLALGEALDDPQPVHVGEGLVDDAQGAELLGLVHDGRDGRSEVRGGWGQWDAPDAVRGRPRGGRRINGGLYQYALIHRPVSTRRRRDRSPAGDWIPPKVAL